MKIVKILKKVFNRQVDSKKFSKDKYKHCIVLGGSGSGRVHHPGDYLEYVHITYNGEMKEIKDIITSNED